MIKQISVLAVGLVILYSSSYAIDTHTHYGVMTGVSFFIGALVSILGVLGVIYEWEDN